jgi:hypothetical protein
VKGDADDPTARDGIALGGEQRVQGFEFGFTGLITGNWRVPFVVDIERKFLPSIVDDWDDFPVMH